MISSVANGIPRRWKRAPKQWGHPLHSICSYLAMLPPSIAHVVIRWLTKPGQVVYDPFSGRGTIPMEACRLGRIGVGTDANPLAVALTSAKTDPPTQRAALARLSRLRAAHAYAGREGVAPNDIAMLYDPSVLDTLIWLRGELRGTSRTDRLITAAILGALHSGVTSTGRHKGLSISMPNTFSMSPNYVRRYISAHNLVPPVLDVFEFLDRRIRALKLPPAEASRGWGLRRDVLDASPEGLKTRPAHLIFSSPPYLNVIKYGKFNWIRLWFLGQDAKEVDGRLLATGSPRRYLDFMSEMFRTMVDDLRPDGTFVALIGDVRRSSGTINLAQAVGESAQATGLWKVVEIISDRVPDARKVSRIWGQRRGRATKRERLLILRRAEASNELPPLGRLSWRGSDHGWD